jgi:integrase/recombinase XerC
MGKQRLPKGFYWRGDIIWIRADPVTGERTSTRCHDAAAAKLWRSERERLASNPAHQASLTASVGEWVLKTIDFKRSRERADGTLHMYGVKLGHIVRLFGKDASLATITPGAVEDYIQQRSREGAKNNTISRELTCLRQMLKIAKRAKVYALDLDEVMPMDFSPEYKPVTRTLRLEDFPKLWAELPGDQERAWVAYALVTGADVGDVERAEPQDYDLARQVVRVRGTKTATRDAEVPIMPDMRELFEWAHARLPLSWPRASKGLGEACRRAGIPHLSPKDLRRTAASMLVAGGANISLVSRFLRHSSDTMARKVYGHVRPEELRSLLIQQTESGTETSRFSWPLGEIGRRRGLKRLGAGETHAAIAGVIADLSGASGPESAPSGAEQSTQTSHPIGVLALQLAAERVLGRTIATAPTRFVTVIRRGKGARRAG